VARRSAFEQRQLVLDMTHLLQREHAAGLGPGSGGGSADAGEAEAEAPLGGPLLARALWAASRTAACPVEVKQRLFEEVSRSAVQCSASMGGR